MSTLASQSVECRRCGASFDVTTAEGLNVTRTPWAREHVLTGRFNRGRCPGCDKAYVLDRELLYTDLSLGQVVQVFRLDELEDWPDLETLTAESLHAAVAHGPPIGRQLLASYRVRTVFSIEALADKLHVWDAGLDDGIVELMKLQALAASDALRAMVLPMVNVTAVSHDADRVSFAAEDGRGDAPGLRFSMPLGDYRALERDRTTWVDRHPGLFHRPFACFLRVRPTAEPSSA